MGGATVRDVCSAELDVSCEVSGFCAFAAACELSAFCAIERVVRLVAQAGKDGSVRQFGTEAVLLLLRGMDVEAGEADVAHGAVILHDVQSVA